MEDVKLDIAGMSCDHCVKAVTGALRALDGVQVGQVKIGTAEVSYDPAKVPFAKLVETVEEAGYQVGPTQLRRAAHLGGA